MNVFYRCLLLLAAVSAVVCIGKSLFIYMYMISLYQSPHALSRLFCMLFRITHHRRRTLVAHAHILTLVCYYRWWESWSLGSSKTTCIRLALQTKTQYIHWSRAPARIELWEKYGSGLEAVASMVEVKKNINPHLKYLWWKAVAGRSILWKRNTDRIHVQVVWIMVTGSMAGVGKDRRQHDVGGKRPQAACLQMDISYYHPAASPRLATS